MVGQSTDIAKEIGDLQGKTAAIGVFALALKGEDGTGAPIGRALGPASASGDIFASIPPRASGPGTKTAATSLLCGPIRRLVAA